MRGVERGGAATAIPEGWRQPITHQESSLESVMAGELETMRGLHLQLLHESEPEPDWLEDTNADPLRWPALRFVARPLYQAQDEINHSAAVYVATADAFAVPVERFPDAARKLKQRAVIDPFPSRLYNVVGDFYRSRGALDFSDYGLRVATVEAWRRAALLTAELRVRGVLPAQMPAEVERATLRSPFDSTDFAWDGARGAVVYTGVENHAWRVQHYVY
jgi:hypothetical protein